MKDTDLPADPSRPVSSQRSRGMIYALKLLVWQPVCLSGAPLFILCSEYSMFALVNRVRCLVLICWLLDCCQMTHWMCCVWFKKSCCHVGAIVFCMNTKASFHKCITPVAGQPSSFWWMWFTELCPLINAVFMKTDGLLKVCPHEIFFPLRKN